LAPCVEVRIEDFRALDSNSLVGAEGFPIKREARLQQLRKNFGRLVKLIVSAAD